MPFRVFVVLLSVSIACTGEAKSFTYDDIVATINTKRIKTIEDLLPELPSSLRSNYTLMHTSRSLQTASYEYPRAILFGSDGRLTCTFNGHPSQRGFDTLECFQYRDSEQRFDFRSIDFPSPRNGLKDVIFSESGKTADGKISCARCHGNDPRPNWNVYSVWPGAYGSNDDGLEGDKPAYLSFVATRGSHPRYKHLIQGPKPTDPYIERGNDVAYRPNLRFSDLIGRMNAARATRILEAKAPEWMKLAFALRSLQCEISDQDENRLRDAGLNYEIDTDPEKLLREHEINSVEWTTRIGRDPHGENEFEHQAGFGFLSIDVAMGIVQNRARLGNKSLENAIGLIRAYYPANYQGYYLGLLQLLNEIIIDPDFYGSFEENTAPICRELAPMFTSEYLKANTRSLRSR